MARTKAKARRHPTAQIAEVQIKKPRTEAQKRRAKEDFDNLIRAAVTAQNLSSSLDPKDWAREFVKIRDKNPHVDTGQSMEGWFSQALHVGYDKGRQFIAGKRKTALWKRWDNLPWDLRSHAWEMLSIALFSRDVDERYMAMNTLQEILKPAEPKSV